jgi:putative ABC transport system permease protein
MHTLRQDFVFGVRMLAKKPTFTAVAALSLALGIGLNTAIFTLIHTILWGAVPYPQPDRIVAIRSVAPGHPDRFNGVSVPDFFAFQERNRSFESLGAMEDFTRDLGAEQNGMPAEEIAGEEFSPELLQALDVQPLIGRLFTPQEVQMDHTAPVMVISYRLWQRRFDGDQDILNRTVLLDGVKTNIIGVMRPDFIFSDDKADFLAPIRLNHFQLRGSARFLLVAGRLKPGVTIQQAQADLESVAQNFAREFPGDMDHGKPWSVNLTPVREAIFGWMGRPLLLLQGAVMLVLLIACANVAALLMARAPSRQMEVAIRTALGAGRMRIFRQFLTESIILSMAGGILGVILAWWGVRALVAMAPPWFPRLGEISIDGRVLLFSLGVSIVTGILFGAAPAAQGSKIRKGSTRATARFRAALVTAQLAIALVLLMGSGLLIRSFLKMENARLGCDPTNLLTFTVRLPRNVYGTPAGFYKGVPLLDISPIPEATLRQVFERVETIPGVESAGAMVFPPLTGTQSRTFQIEGRNVADADAPSAQFYPITPNYFRTMKIPMTRGRDFTMHDTSDSAWVAIINETMARRFWPDEDPIGKHIRLDVSPEEQPREIIAMVGDTPDELRQRRQYPALYVPFFQSAPHQVGPGAGVRFQLTYVLRAQGDPMSLLPAARRAVAEVDPNRALLDVHTEEEQLGITMQYPRYYSMVLGLFAFVATTLAAVGIYGILAYAVEQRTREIGIRMALGAGGWQVLRLMLRQALWMIAGGIAFGLAGSLGLARLISSNLWEVQPADPATFAGVAALLAAVALAASLVPARRAVQVDPSIALRSE